MERIPESLELMADVQQAHAYARSDLSSVNGAIVPTFREHFPEFLGKEVLELGCGAADVAVRFVQSYPAVTLLGIDGSASMIEFGRTRVQNAGLTERIELRQGLLPYARLGNRQFDAVIANSLLHHLSDPVAFWRSLRAWAKPGASILIVDLIRARDPKAARTIVQELAGRADPLVQADFFDSLCAAYSLDEVHEQLQEAGLSEMCVAAVNELQFKIWGRLREV